MDKGKLFKNFAFISYSHADKKAAEELQNILDDFKLSDALKKNYPDRPEVLREIFRDDTGLPAGSNLTVEIQKQLDQSNYLIVICSPNAVKSKWVNKEIEYFKTHRDSTHIIPFIIDGVAKAKSADEPECFPKALQSLEARGANISTFSFERAVIEVIAGALEIDVDDLWQRHVRAAEAKKRQLQEQRDKLLIMQSRFLAEKANDLVDKGDSYTARLLALEALPKDLENPNRPYVTEAEIALRNSYRLNGAVFRGHVNWVNTIYTNQSQLISGSKDGAIIKWDISTGEILNVFKITSQDITAICCDDHIIVVGSREGQIYILDAASGDIIKSWKAHALRINSLFLDSEQLVSCSNDSKIKIWDIREKNCLRELSGYYMSYNNYHIVSASNSYIYIYGTEKQENVYTISISPFLLSPQLLHIMEILL